MRTATVFVQYVGHTEQTVRTVQYTSLETLREALEVKYKQDLLITHPKNRQLYLVSKISQIKDGVKLKVVNRDSDLFATDAEKFVDVGTPSPSPAVLPQQVEQSLADYEARNLKTYENLGALMGHGGQVLCLRMVKNDTLLSGSQDKTIKVWDLSKGIAAGTLSGHGGFVRSLAYSDLGLLFSASQDRTIKVWSTKENALLRTLVGHTGEIYSLYLDGSRLFSGSDDNTIRIWDLNTFQCIKTLTDHRGSVFSLNMAGTGANRMLFSGSRDHTIRAWNSKTYALQKRMNPPHYDSVDSLTVLNDRLFSASRDKAVREWVIPTFECCRHVQAHNDWVTAVVAWEAEDVIATSSRDGTVKVWDGHMATVSDTLRGHNGAVNDLAIANDILLSASSDRAIQVWRFVSQQ